jgi:hypothetical protein
MVSGTLVTADPGRVRVTGYFIRLIGGEGFALGYLPACVEECPVDCNYEWGRGGAPAGRTAVGPALSPTRLGVPVVPLA